jgi:putative thioredoxin
MIEVTIENFEAEVITASNTTPVLVDFWAPWCGPCKSLGPVLEKLELEYEGRFRLVKINSDEEQQLAGAFGVRSIPTCILLQGGRPVDGFMGALPERQVREFLDKHLPSPEAILAESEKQEAEELIASGDVSTAISKLKEALSADPQNQDARFDLVKILIIEGELEFAQEVLNPSLSQIPPSIRMEALNHWIEALKFVNETGQNGLGLSQLDDQIAANKRDFEARLSKAKWLMASGEWQQSMEELLEIIMRDKTWNDELPRKIYVSILELLTPAKSKSDVSEGGKTPAGIELSGKSLQQQDPQTELVSRYRRKLSMMLN